MIGKFVIIRTHSAGVHFGILTEMSADGKLVKLTESRRVHYWDGAASLSQMAIDGIKNANKSRVSVALPEILLTESIEIIPCSENAIENLKNQPIWGV